MNAQSRPGADAPRAWMALASPTRRRIIQLLPKQATAKGIAGELDVSRQAVQGHLDALVDAGIVSVLVQGSNRRPTRYGVAPDAHAVVHAAAEHLLLGRNPSKETATQVLHHQEGMGLEVLSPTPGMWVSLEGRPEWRIGRSNWATLALPVDPFMSGRHAVLQWMDEAWHVRDLGSRNGTYVDRIRLEPERPARVPAESLLRLGATAARVA